MAEAGYRYVEAANHDAENDPGVGFGMPGPPAQGDSGRAGAADGGLHVNPLREDLLPGVLDYHAELGQHPDRPATSSFYTLRGRGLCKAAVPGVQTASGELCQQRGMRFYYHNHYQEFQRFGDKLVYDIIMENTDPGLVYAEMDTYWMARGGQGPGLLYAKV